MRELVERFGAYWFCTAYDEDGKRTNIGILDGRGDCDG